MDAICYTLGKLLSSSDPYRFHCLETTGYLSS